MSRKKNTEQDQEQINNLMTEQPAAAALGPDPEQMPDEAPQPEQPDEAAIEQFLPQITAEEFENKRDDLEETYKGNPEVGENTLNAMIADLLGFSQSGQKWKPFMRYAMRRDDGSENAITLYSCPAGLFAASADLTSDRVNDDYEREKIDVAGMDFMRPATDCIRHIAVFDTEAEVLKDIFTAACEEIQKHIGFGSETMDWLSDVFLGVVKPEPIEEEEELPENEQEAAEDNEEEAAPSRYKSGEQTALDPEIFPPEQSLLTLEKSTILEKLNMVKAKLKFEEEDLKEIKAEQKNAFTMEINSKKQNVEMLERLDNYYEILKAVADAKAHSALSDCTIVAYTTPCSKGKWVHIGTGQNVLEAKVRYGHSSVFEVASFEKGKAAVEKIGDYPIAPDPENAAQDDQEGGELAEAEKVSDESEERLWKCPIDVSGCCMCGKDVAEVRDMLMCDTCHENETCDGPQEYIEPEEAPQDGEAPASETEAGAEPDPGTDESEEGAA